LPNGMTKAHKGQLASIGVIENDAEFREELLRQLSRFEFVRAPVREWESAELYLRETPRPALDLLFVDIRLPGMTGLELVKTLQQRGSSVKAVMLTNMNADELIFEAIKRGVLGYILKSDL